MKRLLWLLCFSLALAAPKAYYPSSVGYSWTYSSGEVQVFSREENGSLVLEHKISGRPTVADLLRYTEKGVLLEGLIVGKNVQKYNPPLQLYPASPLSVGQEWGGRSMFGGQSVALLGKVVRIEGVNVPAGRFNAYVMRTSTVTGDGGSVVVEVYFVPGVGIVRYGTPDGKTVDLVKVTLPK
jgi:hypothetical protein